LAVVIVLSPFVSTRGTVAEQQQVRTELERIRNEHGDIPLKFFSDIPLKFF